MAGLPSDQSERSLSRTIVESDTFTEDAKDIEPDSRLVDEWLFTVKWQLSWVPEIGRAIPETDLYVIDFAITPPVRIVYRFDDNTVTLLGIERLDDQG